ncbi:MAG: helix-turn-helix transcriptional regulator, partial [Kiloniellales bacterium]|nr:helix-turn-helix transcriptional regulator [Kiloniellales bacterium]
MAATPADKVIGRHLGVRLRERRSLLGLTQNQLAKRLGVTFQQVQKYENGS